MARPSKFSAETFIYALIDPRSDEFRYIGKANDVMARFTSHLRDSIRRDTPVYRWVRKLAALDQEPRVCTLVRLTGDWRQVERDVISEHRAMGCRLLNVADGGDEPYCPVEVRRANALKVTAARRKNVMRTYRVLESNIRFVERRNNPALLQKLRDNYQRFKKAVARHKLQGTADILDARLGEYLNSRGLAPENG
jgi:hypothetical protein